MALTSGALCITYIADHDGDGFVSWKDLECLLEEVEAIARKEEFIRTKMALIGVWHTLHDAIHREEVSIHF